MSTEIKTVAKIVLQKFKHSNPGDRFLYDTFALKESFQIPPEIKKFHEQTINWVCEQGAIKLITSPSPMMEVTEKGLELLANLESEP